MSNTQSNVPDKKYNTADRDKYVAADNVKDTAPVKCSVSFVPTCYFCWEKRHQPQLFKENHNQAGECSEKISPDNSMNRQSPFVNGCSCISQSFYC